MEIVQEFALCTYTELTDKSASKFPSNLDLGNGSEEYSAKSETFKDCKGGQTHDQREER